jgi:hypothetical protein
VFWIWLVLRHAHSFSTGPVERYFSFLCAHCRTTTAAFVRAFGMGSGRNPWMAQQNAYASLERTVYRAVTAAGCPCCGRLQPQAIAAFERAAERATWRRSFGLPLAGAFALLAAALVGVFAFRDRHASLLLFGVAASAGVVVFGLVLGIAWARVPMPFDGPYGVWFSQDPSRGPQSWFPAKPGPPPAVVQPNGLVRGVALGATVMSAIAAVAGLVLWSDTFRKAYVVNTSRAAVDVTIDGAHAGQIGPQAAGDAPYQTFEVRTGAVHKVEIKEADGSVYAYAVDPGTADTGWVLAPRARARGLCLTRVTWYYGTKPKDDPADGLLNAKLPGDFVPLARSYDHLFAAAPSHVETQSGSSTTRTTLRAFDCDDLARDKTTPWSGVPR